MKASSHLGSIGSTTARQRVLVVGCDASQGDQLPSDLETHFDVEWCKDGVEAFELLESGAHFDVLCTDSHAPETGVMEFLGQLAKREHTLGVVVISSETDPSREELRSHVDTGILPLAVVRKPHEAQDLVDAVQRAAAFARMRRAVSAASRSVDRLKAPGR